MFSQACVSHSVHNPPHGYSVTAHPCYGAVGTHPTGIFSCASLVHLVQEMMKIVRVMSFLCRETTCQHIIEHFIHGNMKIFCRNNI